MLGGTLVLVTTTSDITIGAAELGGEVSRVIVEDTSSIVANPFLVLSSGAGFRGNVDFLSSLEVCFICFLLVVKRSDFFFGLMISRVSETGC